MITRAFKIANNKLYQSPMLAYYSVRRLPHALNNNYVCNVIKVALSDLFISYLSAIYWIF